MTKLLEAFFAILRKRLKGKKKLLLSTLVI